MKTDTFNLKKTSLLLATCLCLHAAPSAFYIELDAGVSIDDTLEVKDFTYTFKQGLLSSFALGYQADTFRFEIQERYKKDSLHSISSGDSLSVSANGDLVTHSQMLNFYYSGYNHSKLISTIGLGVGISAIKVGDNIDESSIFSTQASFSVGYKMSKSFILSTKYAYFYTLEKNLLEANGSNNITLGLRYLF